MDCLHFIDGRWPNWAHHLHCSGSDYFSTNNTSPLKTLGKWSASSCAASEIYLLPSDQIPPTNINQINTSMHWGLWEQFYILLHSSTSRRSDWGHLWDLLWSIEIWHISSHIICIIINIYINIYYLYLFVWFPVPVENWPAPQPIKLSRLGVRPAWKHRTRLRRKSMQREEQWQSRRTASLYRICPVFFWDRWCGTTSGQKTF